jgi:arylsulfatase
MSRSRTSWVAAIAAIVTLFGGTLAAFRPVRVGVRTFLTGEPGSPSATIMIDGHYLPAPPQKFGGQIGLDATDSKPYWPARIVPPKGAPNVLLIMTDDAGYGVSGTFGGVIPTPALDRIAKMGLRYT